MRSPVLSPFRRWLRVEQLEDRTTPNALTVQPGSFATDHILVSMARGTNPAAATATLGTSPLAAGVQRIGFDIYQVNLQPGVSVGQAVGAFGNVGGVAFAEPDYTIGLNAIPNDPSFGSLWGLNNTGQSAGTPDADIDAPEAWDIATGTGNTIVAVIDTGVDYTHPDLAANMWRNPGETAGDGIDNDGNGIVDDVFGADFANNDGNPMDDNNHGTHCAGTIGAVGNNAVGVSGVAWKTKIMALKFLTASGGGSTADAIKCIDYAVAKGAKILSNSWGGGGYSMTLETAITNAKNAGVIFVAAAGNNGSNNDTTANYPSNYAADNVVAVAATDRNDKLASFSNYGATTVDLAAPGVSILSTTPNNTYSTFSGTSMATPHVAGALAVFWDANPSLTYSQVIGKLLGSVDPIAALAGKSVSGGRLNLKKLLDSASPPPPPPPDTTGARVAAGAFAGASPNTFDRVRLTFSEAINPASFTTADVVALTGKGGAAITPTGVVAVSGTTNQFDVTFASTSAYGTGYSITVGPNILDLAGFPMDQNQNGVNGESTADRYTTSATLYPPRQVFARSGLSVPINDLATASVNIVVPTTSVVNGFTVADLNVTVSLTHTYTSDLVITLTSPSGKVITLFNRRGGAGDNLTGTTFNDEAGTAIAAGAAPFSGSFRPDAALSGFDGLNPVGTWVLKVQDVASLDTGRITAVSINIATDPNDTSSVKTFGGPDEDFTTAPVRVGGKAVVGIAPPTNEPTPRLLAPPTPAAVKFVPSRVQPPADAGVTVARPAGPPSAPTTRFEFSPISPEEFAARVIARRFEVE